VSPRKRAKSRRARPGTARLGDMLRGKKICPMIKAVEQSQTDATTASETRSRAGRNAYAAVVA
jgi:hypothetical protein